MLFFIWFCVMAQAFVPNGKHLADAAVCSIQTQMREQVEGNAPAAPMPSRRVIRSAAYAR